MDLKNFLEIDSVLSAVSRCCYHVFILFPFHSFENTIKIYGDSGSLYGTDIKQYLSKDQYLDRFYTEDELVRLYEYLESANTFIVKTKKSIIDSTFSVDLNIFYSKTVSHLVNHSFTPLVVTDNGKVLWYLVSLSIPKSNEALSEIDLYIKDYSKYYYYAGGRWNEKHFRRCTHKEQSVIELLASGMSQKQIACKLGCSEDNIKGRCANIYKKLRCPNMVGAIMKILHFDLFSR